MKLTSNYTMQINYPDKKQALSKKKNDVSFGIHNYSKCASTLKPLLPYGIPDIYSDIILLDPDVLKRLLAQKVFSKPIRSVIREIKPSEASLFPVPKQFFEMVKSSVPYSPKKTLTQYIKGLASNHANKLSRMQEPIVEELEWYTLEFPPELREKYLKLIFSNKFNRTVFIEELKTLTNTLEDEGLARKIIQAAIKLPSSKNNLTALIMKLSTMTPEKIGKELLAGSVGNIEHLKARKNKGFDELENCALASTLMNAEKAHQTFAEVFRKNPMIRFYLQYHIDRLIALANRGIFDKLDISRFYIYNLAEKFERLAKATPPLNIDTDALKY